MKKILLLLILIFPPTSFCGDWPPDLVNKTYNGCMKNSGKAQCDCLVTRLQYKYSFAEMQRSMQNKFGRQELQQSINTFNMKCLDADFKKETQALVKP